MNNVVNFTDFKKCSYKSKLNDFYHSLEKECSRSELSTETKKFLFNKFCGKFISLHRKKKNAFKKEVAAFSGLSFEDYTALEIGNLSISDNTFFRLCNYLNAANEVSIFLERIEEAFDPSKRKARYELAITLKNQFGIQFTDSKKYMKNTDNKIIAFTCVNEKPRN